MKILHIGYIESDYGSRLLEAFKGEDVFPIVVSFPSTYAARDYLSAGTDFDALIMELRPHLSPDSSLGLPENQFASRVLAKGIPAIILFDKGDGPQSRLAESITFNSPYALSLAKERVLPTPSLEHVRARIAPSIHRLVEICRDLRKKNPAEIIAYPSKPALPIVAEGQVITYVPGRSS